MADDESDPGPNVGTPGAFARDVNRVQDDPITVNYHRDKGFGGEYHAECPECGEWHEWHNQEGAEREAELCCGGARA